MRIVFNIRSCSYERQHHVLHHRIWIHRKIDERLVCPERNGLSPSILLGYRHASKSSFQGGTLLFHLPCSRYLIYIMLFKWIVFVFIITKYNVTKLKSFWLCVQFIPFLADFHIFNHFYKLYQMHVSCTLYV